MVRMNGEKSTRISVFYILAFLIALVVRFLYLGTQPLNDSEASLALQALEVFGHGNPGISAVPSYLAPTAVLFFVFGSSTFLARLMPAIAGSFMSFFPYFFRKRIGNTPALICAFFISMDPFLIHLSKTADPAMIGITSFMFLLAAILLKNPIGIGIFTAIFTLSGSGSMPVFISFTVGGLLYLLFQRISLKITVNDLFADLNWQKVLIAFSITLILLGSVFLMAPSAFSGTLTGVQEYIEGWFSRSTEPTFTPVLQMLIGLLAFAPLGIILGVTGFVRGIRKKDNRLLFLFTWWLVSIILTIIYPNRQVDDLALSMVPLWLGSAWLFADTLTFPKENKWMAAVFTVLCSLLLFFIWMKLASLLVLTPETADHQLAIAALLGATILIAFTSILIGWGWSWDVAKFGLAASILLVFAIFSLGMGRRASGWDNFQKADLLSSEPKIQESDIVVATIEDISLQNGGIKNAIDISVVDFEKPSLKWLLRDFPNSKFVQVLAPGASPSLIITSAEEIVQAPAEYRGQDFSWGTTTPWSLLSIKEWMQWLAFGDAFTQHESVILWARNDLFPLYTPNETDITP
jgi:hypothetical protein